VNPDGDGTVDECEANLELEIRNLSVPS